ncbi:uncharacterized protein UHO2_00414 [Ustilago hordei]|uniref:uncharacterized protein n=1 Tax=Ustilago hordei TaxID=120017 RepID=UPI001A46ED1D|nr:uncharacterized protein UHO2_00414 [Ustilago hordei]SYW81919.1 uncharacterized protein UHO2_00414 [Ustilago hordei]
MVALCNLTGGLHLQLTHWDHMRCTYLSYSNTTHAIKGHQAWLPELNHVNTVKDICFSELKHPSGNPPPFHVPVLSSKNELLKSYSWLPSRDTLASLDHEDNTTSSLQHFSQQQEAQPPNHIAGDLDPYPKWDCVMSDIHAVSEIIIDMDAISTDLNTQLDDTTAKGGTDATPVAFTYTSPLESPQFNPHNEYTLSTPKSPSSEAPDPLGMLSSTAFAMSCAIKPAMKNLGHYLDQIAFATGIMNRVALVTSSQELCSTDGILLKP